MLNGLVDDNEISSNKIIGKTKKGKELGIMRDKCTGLFRICFKSGGELPEELSGLFTNAQAEASIKNYLEKNK